MSQSTTKHARIIKASTDGSKIVAFKTKQDRADDQGLQSKVEEITNSVARDARIIKAGLDGGKIVAFDATKESLAHRNIDHTGEESTDLFGKLHDIRDLTGSQASGISNSYINVGSNLTPETIKISRKQLVKYALKMIVENITCQSAAIFLFSKNGRLEQAGVYGVDKHNQELDDKWFEDESYTVHGSCDDVSFTGRAAKPSSSNCPYGEPQRTESLQGEDLKQESFDRYKEKFGELKGAVAVPLNGKNRTYGVLRIINKISPDGSVSKEAFSDEDVEILLLLSAFISNALSNFRRELESKIFKHLSRLIILQSTTASIEELQETLFKGIVDLLVRNPETPFQVAILRIKECSGKKDIFKICAKSSCPDNLLEDRDDTPIEEGASSLIWKTVGKGEPLIVPDLQTDDNLRSQFRNKKWIERKKFTEFGCFPLATEKKEVFGSLSVYIGFNYRFYPDIIKFLQGIVDLLALSIMKIRQEEQAQKIRELQNQLLNIQQHCERSSGTASIDQEFSKLATAWKEETKSLPVLQDKFRNHHYRQIIFLGDEVVPLLIRELQKKPEYWFYALESISGISPVKDEDKGKISCMVESWVEWGKKRGYVSIE